MSKSTDRYCRRLSLPGTTTHPAIPNEHAVGVESDVIVDVKTAIGPGGEAGTRAIDLVKLMLRKVSSTN